jgi:outer membrane protein OmpA-like peptidoglycan-associated protein
MKPSLFFLAWFLLGFNLVNAQDKEQPAYRIFSIYFGGGSYYIDGEQVQDLYKWLDEIPDIETQEISIHSHTDNIGSLQYNQTLSQLRSEAAFNKLLQKGIPYEIITIADYGEQAPVYSNDTMDGKLRNRRVDIIIKPLTM